MKVLFTVNLTPLCLTFTQNMKLTIIKMKKQPLRMELKSKIPFTSRESVHLKANWLKEQIFKRVGSIEMNDLEIRLRRVTHYHYGYRTSLDQFDNQIYEALKDIEIHPHTALRWISFTLLPEDIQKRKQISVKRAINIAQNRQKQIKARLGLEIIGDIQQAIENLK